MKISHGTQFGETSDKNGYGYATSNMLASLHRLGYEVNSNDPTADVEIWFDQPHNWKFSKGPYKIGYHPWESTQLKEPEWADYMNECDEIWTPSPLIAEWYKKHMNIQPPVYVYEHGVDPVWKPTKREISGKFKFLHVGGQASRKGVRETMHSFRRAFPNNNDVELNLKIISEGWNIGRLARINVINEKSSLQELINLYLDNHVYVYPSWGEGFGLTPLQAMATGMPTITLPGWAPYAQFLDPNLSVRHVLDKSPWPKMHPGYMMRPNANDVIEGMRYAYTNYDEVHDLALSRTEDIFKYYDWDRLTKEAFGALENRL